MSKGKNRRRPYRDSRDEQIEVLEHQVRLFSEDITEKEKRIDELLDMRDFSQKYGPYFFGIGIGVAVAAAISIALTFYYAPTTTRIEQRERAVQAEWAKVRAERAETCTVEEATRRTIIKALRDMDVHRGRL